MGKFTGIDGYGAGQTFGEFAVAYCRQHNIDIDDFYKDIKENSSMFIAGLGDGIGSNRDRKRINIEVKA